MTKFCIVGANGFIGRSLTLYLLDNGHSVIALSRKLLPVLSHPNYKFASTSYRNINQIVSALEDSEVLINLASPAHFHSNTKTIIFDELYSANSNLYNLIIASKRASIIKIIHVSSAGVLGKTASSLSPFSSTSHPHPYNSYTLSKATSEIILKSTLINSCIDYVILRPPLVYANPCPGRFNSLVKLISILPCLPFASLSNQRSFISLQSLLSAIIQTALNPNISNKEFVISDKYPVRISNLINTLFLCLRDSPSGNFQLHPQIISSVAHLSGFKSQWEALSLDFVINPSALESMSDWIPEINTLQVISDMYQRSN